MYIKKEKFKADFQDRSISLHAKPLEKTTDRERYITLVSLLRDKISKAWISTQEKYQESNVKQVYYFSIEFLLGRLLGTNLVNMGLREIYREALLELDIDLARLEAMEEDAGLGNGGLGRLAACYLDSMAAVHLPGHGCGLRYKYGLFEQKIVDGYQVELPDNWLKDGNYPWEIRKSEEAIIIKFGGTLRVVPNAGVDHYIHDSYEPVLAIPYDVPIVGYQNDIVNTLRLWSAEAVNESAYAAYTHQSCQKLISCRRETESITDTLYPDDSTVAGRILRLRQEYFLASASLQGILREYKKNNKSLFQLPQRIAIHINDTHPALLIPELMRLLVDEEGLGWEEAWQLTTSTFSYTNHTILPEALEKWPIEIFKSLLPRIYMIINEINERFCSALWERYPGEWNRIRDMAIIADGNIHMAHLAITGSHSVNGVARLHTEILKNQVMNRFYQFYPHRFNNKTNGVTHRRWLLKCNPRLAELISASIGQSWIEYPCNLIHLTEFTQDSAFLDELSTIKRHNKSLLADLVRKKYGINLDIDSIFDVQVKRIHAYKRQTMNIFHIMDLYNRLRANSTLDIVPHTFIFGGKAAPSYYIAKKTIKLINTLSQMVNNDKTIQDKIKIIFLENYNVSLAELIFPAADVSEQIPTASREASGTANMKMMMNGAVTIGTLDGANIEIRNAIGEENIITFGMTADQVLDIYHNGGYSPWDLYNSDSRVKTVLDQLINGFFPIDHEEFRDIYDSMLYRNDYFFTVKDLPAYIDAQNRLKVKFCNRNDWLRMSLHNLAHSGKFSSDRTFTEYAMDIWKVTPSIPVRCYCKTDDDFSLSMIGCELSRTQPTYMQ